jgi:biopolymer transport protein ExbD
MLDPRLFAGRLKYAVLALLILVTVGYGYYLFRTYWPMREAEKYTVPVAVMVDGTVRIDGALFESPEKLKLKVAQIQSEHPDAGFSIQAPRGETLEPVAKAVVLLQKSGAKTVWVINEPQKASP